MARVILFTLLFLVAFIQPGLSLDCYMCAQQDNNDDKCVRSVSNCQYDEDMCMTEILWSTTPYWQAGAKKQFYISKRCATKQECQNSMRRTQFQCTHVWYEDWRCSECCAGDKCNYYVFSGVGRSSLSALLAVPCLLFVLWQMKN